MKIKEIIEKKDKDLISDLTKFKAELTKIKFEVASKETNKHTDIAKIKKDIARINTIMRERAIQREEEKNEKNT